jgi:protein gp37
MGTTTIEWTDVSWPLANGCRVASPGCLNCYAARLSATRLKHHPKYKDLAVLPERKGLQTVRVPRWTGEVRMAWDDLMMPLRLRKASRIFVANMGDLFYEEFSLDDIDAVFGVMLACATLDNVPAHTFQVLTKRAGWMRDYLSVEPHVLVERWAKAVDGKVIIGDGDVCFSEYVAGITGRAWKDGGLAADPDEKNVPFSYSKLFHLLSNLMLGVSVENQEWGNKRILDLLQTPAAQRYISYEPALGPLDLTMLNDGAWWDREGADLYNALTGTAYWSNGDHGLSGGPRLDWVIVGGESGPGSRGFDLRWARAILDQCKHAKASLERRGEVGGPALFIKQLGSSPLWVPDMPEDQDWWKSGKVDKTGAPRFADRKGADPSEWPEEFRVREFPPRLQVGWVGWEVRHG